MKIAYLRIVNNKSLLRFFLHIFLCFTAVWLAVATLRLVPIEALYSKMLVSFALCLVNFEICFLQCICNVSGALRTTSLMICSLTVISLY